MGQRLSPILWPSARHQPKLQDHGHGANASYGVPVYLLADADTKLYCLIAERRLCVSRLDSADGENRTC